ncbi:hypothetical protein ACTZWW_03120 [Salinarimonas sp. NSM]|uniref:hypothetical protein n=1 Tax=Salinarimonas sp. NSM TaxID=3458003 RepID=UPI00403514A2
MSIRISALNPTATPSRDAAVPVSADGLTNRYSVAQMLGLMVKDDLPTLDGGDIGFDPAGTELTATELQGAVEEVLARLKRVPVDERADAYTITPADVGRMQLLTLNGARTFTLPLAADVASGSVVWVGNSGNSTLTVQRSGANTIVDPSAGVVTSISLARYETAKLLRLDASSWSVVARNKVEGGGTFSTLSVSGAATFAAGSASTPSIARTGDTDTGLFFPAANTMGCAANGGEVWRTVQSAFLVGRTSTTADGLGTRITDQGTMQIGTGGTGSVQVVQFYRGSVADTLAGSISSLSATTVSFNTSSDERLKDFGEPDLAPGLVVDDLAALLAPYTWKLDGASDYGMSAQAAHAVLPAMVTPGNGEPGEPDFMPWQVDWSKAVPRLIAYVKLLELRVAALEAASSGGSGATP